MKFLNFQAFVDLAELTSRANGKTHEAVRYALNVLFNGPHRSVLFIAHSRESCEYARTLATEMIFAHPEYPIEICKNNRFGMEFFSGAGTSHLLFTPFSTSLPACRGRTLDEIVFDLDPETLFKGSQKEDGKFKELVYSVVPTMVSRPRINPTQLKQFF